MAGRHIYRKLLVVSELFRQQNILYDADTRNILNSIMSLCQAHISRLFVARRDETLSLGQ